MSGYYLLPKPKECKWGTGTYLLQETVEIVLSSACALEVNEFARLLKEELRESLGVTVSIARSLTERGDIWIEQSSEMDAGEYELSITQEGVILTALQPNDLLHAVQTLRQIIRQSGTELPFVEIKDKPDFKVRGFYHDVTRGKIPTMETLYGLIDRMSFYKLNQLQLYVEHTFAYVGHEEIWSGAEPLTAEDILNLDEYCLKRGIELVPSFSVFGHLYHHMRSDSFKHLCELGEDQTPFAWYNRMQHHTVDVSNTESFILAADMLDQVLPLFSSNKFNICGDETFDLGRGKSRELAEKIGKGKLYADYLSKLIEHVENRGKRAMFWGDIILKYPEYLEHLPKNAICLNWEYGMNIPVQNVEKIEQSGLTQYVCPGVGGWNRIINSFASSFVNIRGMAKAGYDHHAEGVLNTDWGDFGHINLLGGSMPGMIFGGAVSWNQEITDDECMKAISVLEYGDTGEEIMDLLYRLGKQEICNWRIIALWYDVNKNNLLKDEYEEEKKVLEEITSEQWQTAAAHAKIIQRELTALMPRVRSDRKQDVQEFILAAKGISLFNEITEGLITGDFSVNPSDLAQKLELWYDSYTKSWRLRNKESELARIGEVLHFWSSHLRNEYDSDLRTV